MSSTHADVGRPAVVEQPAAQPVAAEPAVTGAAAGDPAVLGLPAFAVGSVALGLALVGYVSPAAQGGALPIIFAMTGIGLLLATVWAAALGQTMVATIFGLFSGFWLSYTVLIVGLTHNWFGVPLRDVQHTIALFLISWAAIMAALTLATLRLPVAYTAVVALVVIALVLLIFGTLDTNTTINKVAGYVTLVFGALGIYLFMGAASVAGGGPAYPVGKPVLKD
jgi:succinate-acetate transporter protein